MPSPIKTSLGGTVHNIYTLRVQVNIKIASRGSVMSVQGPGSGAHKHFTATYGTAYDSKSSEVEDNFQMKASVIYLTLLLGESAGGPAGVRLLLPPGDHLPLLHLVLLHGQYSNEDYPKVYNHG